MKMISVHTYASGYDWVNNFDGVVEDMDRELGIQNVKAIHLNDSMVECGSNKDRHANLGEGKLGENTISKILHYKRFKDTPFILETPALKGDATIPDEVKMLMKLAK